MSRKYVIYHGACDIMIVQNYPSHEELIEQKDDLGSDCITFIDKQEVRVKIIHVGRGKFKIIRDDGSGKHVGKIIDASDVIHCRSETV